MADNPTHDIEWSHPPYHGPAPLHRGSRENVVPLWALVYRDGRPRGQKSIRRTGRVTTEYVASGAAAESIAALETACATATRWPGSRRKEREGDATVEGALRDYSNLVEAIVRVHLFAAGYHRPKRQWRRAMHTIRARPCAALPGASQDPRDRARIRRGHAANRRKGPRGYAPGQPDLRRGRAA